MGTFEAPNDYRSYLAHHGIKGQKWGVRHGPPYPIKSGIMPKGTRRTTTTHNPLASGILAPRMYTYDPNNEHDTKVYTGPFAKYTKDRLRQRFGYDPKLFSATYEATKDLKIAGKEDQIDDAYKIAKDNPQARKDLQQIKEVFEDSYKRGESLTERNKRIATSKVDFDNLTDNDKEFVFDVLNAMMEAADHFFMSREFTKAMSEKFEGIVDFNNQDVYNDAQDPVLVFDPANNLRVVGIKEIPMSMIDEHLNNIRDYMAKTGRNAAL